MKHTLLLGALLLGACARKPQPAIAVSSQQWSTAFAKMLECDPPGSATSSGTPYGCRDILAEDCKPNGGYADGLNVYKCDPATKRWVIDEEVAKRARDRDAHLNSLAFALVSRVLTDKEMREVESLGARLYMRDMQPYRESELREVLNSALLQQFRLRIAAKGAAQIQKAEAR